MKLYRYSSIDKDEGFIQVAYDYDESDIKGRFTDEIFDLGAIFEDELKAPDVTIFDGTKFYFTEKGNRHFHKAIKKLCEFLNKNNIATIDCKHIEIDNDDPRIIYQDTYQVAMYDKGSTTSLLT